MPLPSHKSTRKIPTESLSILINPSFSLTQTHTFFMGCQCRYPAFLSMGTRTICTWHRNKWGHLHSRAVITGFLMIAKWFHWNTQLIWKTKTPMLLFCRPSKLLTNVGRSNRKGQTVTHRYWLAIAFHIFFLQRKKTKTISNVFWKTAFFFIFVTCTQGVCH